MEKQLLKKVYIGQDKSNIKYGDIFKYEEDIFGLYYHNIVLRTMSEVIIIFKKIVFH
jgi:hypothetical protein